jgi:hypothetical protein
MIIIGSGALLAIGLLILLVQAISIAFSLIRIVYYLLKGAVYLVVLVVCAVGLGVQYVMRWLKPEPVTTVNIMVNDEDVLTIELPRDDFHRVRG